jgi:hypothetical protein
MYLDLRGREFWRQRAFDTPRFRQLYRRWLTDGDSVFEAVSSPAIAETLERGTGRIEAHVIVLWYRHLARGHHTKEGDFLVLGCGPATNCAVTSADKTGGSALGSRARSRAISSTQNQHSDEG